MVAIAFVKNEALDDVADQRLHLRDHGYRQRPHMDDELAIIAAGAFAEMHMTGASCVGGPQRGELIELLP